MTGSSAAVMWTLVHNLQIYRYILMVNMDMPKLIEIIMKYLAVAVGEIEEIHKLVPDIFSSYILNAEEMDYNFTLYSRFIENGT